jgi:hypothetical protein
MKYIRQRWRIWSYRRWERNVMVLYYRDDLDTAPVKPTSPLVARFIGATFPGERLEVFG